jgi:hypothetical protein
MIWQVDVFEMRTNCFVVGIRNRAKYLVADRFAGGIRSLVRLHDLEVFDCHNLEPKTIPDAGSESWFAKQPCFMWASTKII